MGKRYIMTMGFSLFPWLVEFHIAYNLPKAIPHLKNGQVYNQGKAPQEGLTETGHYKGFVIIANGGTLAEKLHAKKLLKEPLRSVSEIPNIHAFLAYLATRENPDGVFVYDGEHRKIARAGLLNNFPELPHGFNVYNQFSSDFVIHNHSSSSVNSLDDLLPPDLRIRDADLGTRTRVAATYPHVLPETEGLVLKQTAYTKLGLGKVARFTQSGLAEEFFFMHDPQSRGPFVNEEHRIVGVTRNYARKGTGLLKTDETLWEPTAKSET